MARDDVATAWAIGWMTERERGAVARIEAECRGWTPSRGKFDALAAAPRVIVKVARPSGDRRRDGSSVVGFAAYAVSIPDRGGGPTTRRLLYVGVEDAWRRIGVGRALVEDLLSGSDGPSGQPRPLGMVAMVRGSDLAGQILLRACGLRATSVVRGHFDDGAEDGYWFERPGGGG